MITVKFKKITNNEKFVLPMKKYRTDAGMDFVYWGDKNIEIIAGGRAAVPLGCAIEFPEGYELQIRPRSGLALNNGITILNTPGTVDCGFGDELRAIIFNSSDSTFVVEPMMKICQGVIMQLPEFKTELAEEISDSERKDNGFGSSGLKVGE